MTACLSQKGTCNIVINAHLNISKSYLQFRQDALQETLHNRADETPSQPSTPVDTKDAKTFSQRKNKHERNTTIEGIGPRVYQHYSPDKTYTSSAPDGPSNNYISGTLYPQALNLIAI